MSVQLMKSFTAPFSWKEEKLDRCASGEGGGSV